MAIEGHNLKHQADEQGPHMPYIPPEVHRIIAQYVHSSDLPNYRLVSKTFLEFGTEELFSTITFHCSSKSIARIDAMKRCQHLNKLVKTMVWDTNFWKIPNVSDLSEWRRYFRGRAFAARWSANAEYLRLAERYDSLESDREEWGRYLDNTSDEKKAKSYRNLQAALSGFHNLAKLHVLNGDLVGGHRGVKRSAEDVRLPEDATQFWRGESLYNNGISVYSFQRPCGHALAAMQNFQGITWHLTKLRLNAVCGKVFYSFFDGIESLQNLSSLHLRMTVQSKPLWGRDVANQASFYDQVLEYRRLFRLHDLMGFLVRLPELRSLKLDFYGRSCDENDNGDAAPATLGDVFARHHTWPKLRKLSLLHVDTVPEAFLSLLERHHSTLKILKLHALMLEPERVEPNAWDGRHVVTWAEIFDKMRGDLHLERAAFSGYFSIKDASALGCNFNDERLALAAEAYLVDGKESPFV